MRWVLRDGKVAVVMNNRSALKSRKLWLGNEIHWLEEENANRKEWLDVRRETLELIHHGCNPCYCQSCQKCDCSQGSEKE
ncbi:MAG: hypothetical protein LBF72_03090 [Holosporales bacterium]|jgi:CRISPR/Cas system-associated exonuclease Cas4 (RecB family)|nr:hypothetical protein [Holosporales bacterium]